MLMIDGRLEEETKRQDLSRVGVYEVIRIIAGQPLFLNEHFARFSQSVKKKGYPLPFDVQGLRNRIDRLLQTQPSRAINVRLEYGPVDDTFCEQLFLVEGTYPSEAVKRQGVFVTVANLQRKNPQVKTIDKGYKEKAADWMRERGAFEVLLQNDKGEITEGSRSNLFLIEKDRFIESPPETTLAGITRMQVIALIEKLGYALERAPIDQGWLDRADAAFLTGTSIDVLPIAGIDERRYRTDHPALIALMQAYETTKMKSLHL